MYFKFALAVLFYAIHCTFSNAQSAQPFGEVIQVLMQQTKIPGLSVAISKQGEIVYTQGFGYADVENKIAMSTTTELRTASVAKVITATALGKLVSDGKLDLDTPIQQYVPYIDKKYAHLTCRQLAGHTSGMTHRPKGSKHKKRHYDAVRPTVELIKEPLLFTPATEYKYSTNAFNLLAAAIEGASGQPYSEYLQTEIFEPLGMQQTYPENINQLSDQAAQLYYFKKGQLTKERELTSGSYKLAGAGFRSTPTDLVKMMNAYTNGFISPKVAAEMFQSQQLTNGKSTQVGITWRQSFDAFGHPVIEHAGNWIGARTVVVHYPKEQLTISLMTNTRCQIFIKETAHLLAQVFRNQQVTTTDLPSLNQAVQVAYSFNSDDTQQYVGTLNLSGKSGILESNSDGFLKSNPVISLGSAGDYALATSYGLFYLKLATDERISGKGYMYGSQNVAKPQDGAAAIIIKAQQ